MNKEMENKLVPKLRFPEFEKDNWEEKKLNELGNLIGGLTYSPEDIRDKGLLVLRSSNIQNGQLVLDDCVYVRNGIKGANLIKQDDILVCIRNGSKALIGKNAIIPNTIPIATHGAFMTVFRAYIPKYVFQLFQTDAYLTQVNADLGATINSINGTNFLRYKFFEPKNPKEQQKIADCLSSLDDLITAENEKLEVLKNHKKGLMQQLFPAEGEKVPKLRFAEFKDNGDWEERKLGEVCISIASGKDKLEIEGALDLYGSTGIIGKTNSNSFTGDFILVARVGANAGMLNKVHGTFGVTDNTLVLSFKKNQQLNFVYYLLDNFGLNKLIFGSGQPLVTGGQLKNLLFTFPNSLEQQKIADCLFSLDEQIGLQTQKIADLKFHKKGLMQGLFPYIN